ncbi:BTAD domain-containing putative transcriptional regulator [Streptomyces sp. NPDC020379]|uniref:AfsR/SARP family transcriptional regulator n=1 Tax=Streptomyces sp. NPDC020379 TaxID=3365071 RepID=UPI00378A579E
MSDTSARFSVLGLMSISRGGELVVLPDSKPTTLLAALLLRPGEVVSSDYLQRAVWGDEPPITARATLHTCVLRLRRLFSKFGIADDAITTLPGGYRLPVTGETLDLARFEELTAAADREEAPEKEAALLHDALLLWQGPPISNIRSDTLHRDVVPRLEEERLRAAERWFDIELALGNCGRVLPHLRAAVCAHPGHERFWEHLIEALYRTGRQSEALAEYRAVKQYLSDELGVDPRPSLRRLELAILRGEDLGTPSPLALSAAHAPPSPDACEPGEHRPVPGTRVTPLPPDLPRFTGRERENAALMSAVGPDPDGASLTAVVSGLPGTGKTALALHTAHLLGDAFPGGRWLVRVGAESDTGRLLTDLEQQGWDPYGPRSLLILDDVRTEAAARGLPASFHHATVILTSRTSLAGFAAATGAFVLRLGALDDHEARAVLTSVLGEERAGAEPEAVDELARMCHGSPLALRIAATRLLLRPRHRVADGADWLRDDPVGRLSVGDDPAMSVPCRFTEFFESLDPWLADACRTLAALPDEVLSPEECAAALKLSPRDTAAALDRLTDAGLLEDETPGRYRVPGLLRAYARHCPCTRRRPGTSADEPLEDPHDRR